MVSSKKLKKQEVKADAKMQRRTVKDEWKRNRKQQSRNPSTLAVGILMGLEAVVMGMLSEWIFLAICCLLAFAALVSVRSLKGSAVTGAFIVCFALYFTFLHINTLLVLWPHVDDKDEIFINGVGHEWSHAIWLTYVIKNSLGVIFMFLAIVLGIASIVPAVRRNRKDARLSSPRLSPRTADQTQNVVIETYPPHPGPVFVQTAPLGHATLLQPAGFAYVTNVPPPPGAPYHTLNIADGPFVYPADQTAAAQSPQFYSANTNHMPSPPFQTQAPGYGPGPHQQGPSYNGQMSAYQQAPPYAYNQEAHHQQQPGPQQEGAHYQGAA